ncbi:hypothetical protein [Nocardia arthritidis]|uniref:DUF2269 family protein n=1 Tax=Nocardia arthritidis TaxID=228602 RepID=A0A6G9YK86_9NOCA|nr:hypothetical protein [Nocardia arthritidis]QIS13570.1 hypothetical protein F5544_28595 [Nocardia arthritidis]
MQHLLLSVHVLAGIVFIGGSAIATSLFTRYAPIAADSAESASPERSRAVAVALHRITGAYIAPGVIVPIAGIALAAVQHRLGEVWITVAMALTGIAAGLLVILIHPIQREVLDRLADARRLRTLSMLAGVYNLLWAVVVVLMIVRPGAR